MEGVDDGEEGGAVSVEDCDSWRRWMSMMCEAEDEDALLGIPIPVVEVLCCAARGAVWLCYFNLMRKGARKRV